ncbi:MAG: hypothetical protein R3195_04125 [Gemmatimonadota bacterium]|nr:hypothetical protein [Gemmatimonadota bacterium]
MRGIRSAVAVLGVAVILAVSAADARAQASDSTEAAPYPTERPVPEDTYADAAVRDLIIRAKRERYARAAGLGSFQVTFRERIYAGLGGRVIRRERALFHQERAAEVYWGADGDRIIKWLGVRRGVPIAGLGVEFEEDARRDDAFDLDFDFLDPAEDRVFLGSDWALHPLADSAQYHYRYRSGDTLRIRFPGADRTITLVEAVVEPREGRFDRIVGSLWFDRDQALLARAAYRPAIDFDLEREEPEDAEEVPGFVKPIRATVEFITVDYGLQELRWWLPNRMAFDGTARVGGLATMPVRFEWTFEGYETDRPQTLDPGEDALPEGWTRWTEGGDELEIVIRDEDEAIIIDPEGAPRVVRIDENGQPVDEDGNPVRGAIILRAEQLDSLDVARPVLDDSLPSIRTSTVVIVPPVEDLLSAPELPEPLFSGSVDAFEDDEISQIRSRLDELDAPSPPLPGLDFLYGFSPGLFRFNRVEGFSAAVALGWWTGDNSRFEVTPRIGVPEFEPGLELRWFSESATGSLGIAAYRRLTDLGDWGRPLGFGNSFNSLVLGYDDGLYFRETGGEVFVSRARPRLRLEGRLFGELQQTAPKTTDVSLPAVWKDSVFASNVAADRGTVFGASGRLRVFSGVDPGDPIVSATVWGEAAAGDFDYGRLAVSGSISTPIAGNVTGAVEAGTGTTFGTPSAQRLWYLGGPYTLRTFDPGAGSGEAFWLGRAELGYGFRVGPTPYDIGGSTFRVTAWGDAGWAGPRDSFGTEGWQAAVGAGFSMMDGLLRFDIGRAVRGGDSWRLHIYTDGLM